LSGTQASGATADELDADLPRVVAKLLAPLRRAGPPPAQPRPRRFAMRLGAGGLNGILGLGLEYRFGPVGIAVGTGTYALSGGLSLGAREGGGGPCPGSPSRPARARPITRRPGASPARARWWSIYALESSTGALLPAASCAYDLAGREGAGSGNSGSPGSSELRAPMHAALIDPGAAEVDGIVCVVGGLGGVTMDLEA
jgi:hypothetical protein